ncbi:MAG: hypothetical protein KAG18_04340 [Sinobacterium sp.]|nr:hypothetical protein [Sinobacterium sp.]
MDLLDKPSVITSTQLWIIDDDSLQSRILSKLLAEQLSIHTHVIHRLPNADILSHHTGMQLALINCQNLLYKEITQHLHKLSNCQIPVKVALFNLSTKGDYGNLIKWPQVMAMFEEDCDQRQLVKGLAEVINHGYWLPRHLISFILTNSRSTPSNVKCPVKLTKRETEILEYLSQGLSNAEIGLHVFVSEHTVRSHLYNVYKKIGTKNRIQASVWAKMNLNL